MTPRVSIVIPAYNAERFVARCLDSILSQHYELFEVIVVNDGSKDNTELLLDEYAQKDSRIKVIHKPNGGVSSARNEGLKNAVGEWICFVDIDDYISGDFINEEDFNINADLIVKSWKYSDGFPHNEELTPVLISSDALRKFLSTHLYYTVFRTPWAKLFRRDIIEGNNIRFNSKYRLGEDNLFVLEYLYHSKSLAICTNGYYYYEKNTFGKYPLRFIDTVEYMHDFSDVYTNLKVSCPLFLKMKLVWYSSFITDFTTHNKIKWYSDRKIIQLYKESQRLFPTFIRVKIFVFLIISKLVK